MPPITAVEDPAFDPCSTGGAPPGLTWLLWWALDRDGATTGPMLRAAAVDTPDTVDMA